MQCGFPVAGVRAAGAAGRGLGRLYAGSAGRRSCVRVGIRCSPPTIRGAPWPVTRGEGCLRLGALPPPVAILLGAAGARCPRAVGTGVRVWGPALSPWLVCPVRGVWCQALPLPRLPFLGGGQQGFPRPVCPGCGCRSAPPCGPALRAVGVAEGRPRGGGPFAVVRGV